MYQSIFYKEWIKTQRIILLLCVVFTGLIVYIFLTMGQAFRINGAVNLWETIVQKDYCLLSVIKYVPLLAGILLALAQFTAEMFNKRLKLTLHLPLPEGKIMSGMLLYGLLILLVLFSITETVLLTGIGTKFTKEIVITHAWKSIPWFIGGLAAYLICAWICLEPVWKQRIFNAIPGICALSFFYSEAKSGGYLTFMPYLVLFLILSFFFSFYSTIRFKEGAQ